MQLSDLTDFSKIGEAVNRLSAGSAWFRLSSPADKDDSRKILEGKLKMLGIEDPAAFFYAVKRTGIESPAALYECPPTADIAHLLIEETLNDLDSQKMMQRPVAAAPPVSVVTGDNKVIEPIVVSPGLPMPVRSVNY